MHNHFDALRQRLVDCRATYRQTKDIYDLVKAKATQEIQPTGKNAEERAVALTLALSEHEGYKVAHRALREAETAVERAEALLEAAKDERRAGEWLVRAKLADGLFRAGVASDGDDDGAFDDTADELALHYAEEAMRDVAIENDLVSTNGNALDDEDFPF
jgi:hypothetical protein